MIKAFLTPHTHTLSTIHSTRQLKRDRQKDKKTERQRQREEHKEALIASQFKTSRFQLKVATKIMWDPRSHCVRHSFCVLCVSISPLCRSVCVFVFLCRLVASCLLSRDGTKLPSICLRVSFTTTRLLLALIACSQVLLHQPPSCCLHRRRLH